MAHHDPPSLDPALPPPPRRRLAAAVVRGTGWVSGWLVLLAVVLALLGGIAALALTERTLTLPDWVTQRLETHLNGGLRRGHINLGRIAVFVDRRGVPRVSLLDVALSGNDGTGVAQLNRVQATFDPRALLEGRVAPRSLGLDGAQVTLRRAADGSFAFSFGQRATAFPGMAAVLAEVEAILEQPLFTALSDVRIRDITVSVEDARTSRIWQIVGGQVDMAKSREALDLTLLAEVFNGTDDLARLQVSARNVRGDGRAQMTAQITNVAAQDIALQSPALAVLGVLDAPISGALRASLNTEGQLAELAGTLDIGAGAVRPRAETAPLPFDNARAYFSYSPADQKISFSQISVNSDALTAEITGHAYLRELTELGFPRALVTQLQLTRLQIAPLGLFDDAVQFQQGAADVRLRLNPFTLDIGQLVLSEPGGEGAATRRYAARGQVSADPGGWTVALDFDTDAVPVARALALWPVPLVARTRDWLGTNITSGTLFNVAGAFRKVPGARGDLAVTFGYDGATLRFLRDMPPLENAAGYASVVAHRFAITVEQGQVTPPDGGAIRMDGSVLVVPDTREKPARGELSLISDSTTTALLSLLDLPPLRVLRAAPFGPDLAEGRAQVTTTLELPFGREITPADVVYDANGVLSGITTDRLIPGRTLAADRLEVQATPAALVVRGAATLDRVPVTATWRMGMTPEERGNSRLQGQVELSQDTIDRLRLGLPAGFVSGKGRAEVTVDLLRGQPPRLRLTSDLAGVGLSLSALSWSKPARGTGDLAVAVTLGASPSVDSLSLNAAGLQASGRISLAPGGGLGRAVFDRVRLGGWLDAAVTLSGQGPGAPPAITVSGGTLDFRRASLGGATGGAQGGARGPVTIGLDRLVLSEGISLTGFTGSLAAGRGVNGSFTARVNGGTPLRGELAGGPNGVGLRLVAADAGGVLRDAGLIRNGYDGPMEAVLSPTGARGTYDGTLKVGRIRIRDAPAMADLLGAISVVGLLEQLNGDGLVFDQTEASFRLTPAQVILYRSSATGASLGVSMDGTYDLASRQIDMQGVISPIYLLNRIGAIFTRQGEGLFGFNFNLTGAAARPAVQVNPLSILTPGMFREIFRRPAPER